MNLALIVSPILPLISNLPYSQNLAMLANSSHLPELILSNPFSFIPFTNLLNHYPYYFLHQIKVHLIYYFIFLIIFLFSHFPMPALSLFLIIPQPESHQIIFVVIIIFIIWSVALCHLLPIQLFTDLHLYNASLVYCLEFLNSFQWPKVLFQYQPFLI